MDAIRLALLAALLTGVDLAGFASPPADVPALAGTPLTADELAAFQTEYADHRLTPAGWTGNFRQEARSPDLLTPITSAGNLVYRAPGALELDYTDPVAGEVWVHDDQAGQKFAGRPPQAAAAPLVRSLRDFFRLPPVAWEKMYTVEATRDQTTVQIRLTVKPGAPAGQPARIDLEINPVTRDPQRLEITFSNQVALAFYFSNWQTLPPDHATATTAPGPAISPAR
jgi:hypothetical protein